MIVTIAVLLLTTVAGVGLHKYNQLDEERRALQKEVDRLQRYKRIRLKYMGRSQ